MRSYDCIVVGSGGVGSAALYQLARRGMRVVGIDRFPPGHDRGSSHGESRLIRLAYFEHPNYVPLLHHAYQLWAELAELSSQQLYHETGLLQIGPADGVVLAGVLASAAEHGLEIEELIAAEVEDRFRGFQVPETMKVVFERRAGYLRAEACVLAYLREAQRVGAELRSGETVRFWRSEGSGVRVSTDQESYQAGCLVIAPGAWASQLLGDLGIPFEVRRKSVFWYAVTDPAYRVENGCPVFLYETPMSIFYGVPEIDPGAGIKVAEHSGGGSVGDPLVPNRQIDPEDQHRVEQFLTRYLPGVIHQCRKHEVCLYTMTPDQHLVVDRHPRYPQVVFAAGLSGHGFKFIPVLGEVLADLAIEGRTDVPVHFLARDRPVPLKSFL